MTTTSFPQSRNFSFALNASSRELNLNEQPDNRTNAATKEDANGLIGLLVISLMMIVTVSPLVVPSHTVSSVY